MLRFNYQITAAAAAAAEAEALRPSELGPRTMRSSSSVKRARNPRRHGQHIDVTAPAPRPTF